MDPWLFILPLNGTLNVMYLNMEGIMVCIKCYPLMLNTHTSIKYGMYLSCLVCHILTSDKKIETYCTTTIIFNSIQRSPLFGSCY
jgi:hypothetical protein